MNGSRLKAFIPRGFTGGIGLLLVVVGAAFLVQAASEEDGDPAVGPAIVLEMEGPIGPAIDDYLGRSLEKAQERMASVVIIRMDTPGGLDTSMRAIIRKILDSPIPIAVHVAPEGARATSAGTYILYAAHVASMAPATSVGAATPVQMGGPQQPEPERDEDDDDSPREPRTAMERKMVNDAVSYIRGLAELRGRNADWAEQAVRRGVSLTSSEALEKNVIDYRVESLEDLLVEMDGRTVKVLGEEHVLATEGLEIEMILPDWRTRLLAILTNPNVALILMLVGIYGLIFEFSNPGALVPGVIGAICLLLAMFALHMLPINYAGLALIGLGLALMVSEAFVPSFGALGVGGIVAFILGAIMLMEFEAPGFELHMSVVVAVAIASALILAGIMAMAMKAWKRPVVSGQEAMVGAFGSAVEDFDGEGRVHIQGEIWKALAPEPVKKGGRVKVTGVEGLSLVVEPVNKTKQQKE